jgi:predicted RNA-binding protein with PUA-like domain
VSTAPEVPRDEELDVAERRWLFKSEPSAFSIDDLERAPRRTTRWDGIRNPEARNLLRDRVQAGDLGFFHHSGAKPAIVGIVEVVRAGYPDPTAHDDPPRWYAVDLRFVRRLARPVTLEEIKRERGLADMTLVKRGRLSVQPIAPAEWRAVLALAETRLKRAHGRQESLSQAGRVRAADAEVPRHVPARGRRDGHRGRSGEDSVRA